MEHPKDRKNIQTREESLNECHSVPQKKREESLKEVLLSTAFRTFDALSTLGTSWEPIMNGSTNGNVARQTDQLQEP